MASNRIQRPLKRSVKIGCISFVLVLCLCLGVSIYLSYRDFFFKQSESHIRNIITYVTGHIDNDDLTVPHPLIAERDFVKIPLAEIAKPSLRTAFPEYFT